MLGIGIGVDWVDKKNLNVLNSLIPPFEARVAADGGTFEAVSCLNATLTNLNYI